MDSNSNKIEVTIVPAQNLTNDEVQKLVTLINTAYAQHHRLLPNSRTSVDGLLPEIEGAEVVLLRDQTGEIVGTAYIQPDQDALYLGMVAIDPTRQGQGLGRKLLQAVEGAARQKQLAKIRLMAVVEVGNEAFYLRHGYHTIAREAKPIGTWGSTAAFTDAKMEKTLS